jgi:phosphoglycolate phosphatase
LLASERLAAEHVVMVGDRHADIVAAKANGMRSIGVLWGYGSRDELSRPAPTPCAWPADLPACVARVVEPRDG